jgi:hypothetical protein
MMEMKTYAQCQDVIEKIKRAAAAAAQEVRRYFSQNFPWSELSSTTFPTFSFKYITGITR